MRAIDYTSKLIKRKNIILFIVSIIVLFFSFGHNFFKIGYPSRGDIKSQFEVFQGESEALVLGRVDRITKDKDANLGGFMLIDDRLPSYAPGPYTSQVGLQGILVGIFAPNNSNDLPQYYQHARMFFAFLTALVLSFFILAISYEFGIITATFLLLCISYSTWIIFFAKNLYWSTPLLFIPFVLGWILYSYFYNKKKLKYLFLLIGFAVFIKAMTGYEYITNVAAAALVPILYFQIKEKINPVLILKNMLRVSFAGIIGFFSAIIVHIIQLSLYSHSFLNAFNIIFDRVKVRTYFQTSLDGVYSLVNQTDIFSILKGYLLRPIFGDSKFLDPVYLDSIKVTLPDVSFTNSVYLSFSLIGIFFLLFILISFLIIYRKWTIKKDPKIMALFFTVIISIPISFSWAILAKGHMYFHNHFNEIIFYIPFILMCYLLFGYVLQVVILWIYNYFFKK